jgi:prepilin-type N-terminal cleavage/methylation domain-containing protein
MSFGTNMRPEMSTIAMIAKQPEGWSRPGFTLIELLMVLLIGVIMMSFAVPSFTRMTQSKSAQSARDNLSWMAMRTRARAIERGQVWLLEIDPVLNRARIRQRGVAIPMDSVSFASEFKATISTVANTTIVLCYSPRGFAFSCHANSPSANVDVTFTHRDQTAVARVKPLGQIDRI